MYVHFFAAKTTKSVTQGIEVKTFGNFRLIDTQGFGDPKIHQPTLWLKTVQKLMSNREADIRNEGIAMIVIPLMMSPALRIPDSGVTLIFEIFMLLTICYPTSQYQFGQKMPKIMISINNFGNTQ